MGEEMIKTQSNELVSEIHGFPTLFTSDEAFKLTTQGKMVQSVDNYFYPDDKLLSFFGRVNYDFKSRYLLTATYRADGSSKFLKTNRWGYFPSAAAAWKISEENFMQGTTSWLSNLKVRVSYGESGNNNIPVGQTFQSFVSSTTTWINGVGSFWSAAKTMANPDLKWETTQTRNIGLDFGFLQNRITGSLEIYRNNTQDLLIEFPVPGTGYDNQFRNMGETQNQGVELSLNYAAIDTKDYGLNVSVNFSRNRGTVESLGILEEIRNTATTSGWASTMIGPDFAVLPGQPIGMMFGYRSDGRYEVSDFEGYDATAEAWTLNEGVVDGSQIVGAPRPGMMKLKDLNADGVITTADQEFIGNANPKHTGGIILNGRAYGFDLTASFNWTYGNNIYNANKIEFTTSNPNNQYRNLINAQETGQRWTNVDPVSGTLVTDPSALGAMNSNTTTWSPYMSRYVFSDWAVEDGSFLRLNTLTLGYTVPSSITTRLRIKDLRFYATAYNVFVLTDYSGYDPEVSTRRKTQLTPGVDYSAYPRSRQLVFGLNLNF
jgi:TonB-dependent starch-binding outer membrane protein SusC